MNNTKPSTIEHNGFVNFQTLGNSIIGELVDRGFDLVYPASFGANTFVATLKPRIPDGNTFSPDPLAVSQPWHIHIDCSGVTAAQDPGSLRIYAAHPLQMGADGNVSDERAYDVTPTTTGYIRKSGEMTNGWYKKVAGSFLGPSGISVANEGEFTIPFASKFWGSNDISKTVTSDSGAYTYSYRITVSKQGVALVIWEEGEDLWGSRFSWLVIQRPVSQTGTILQSGKCPVFCMYSIGGGEPHDPLLAQSLADAHDPYTRTYAGYDDNPAVYLYTVRESDVFKATVPALASCDSPDHRAVINAKQQVAITENNKYVVSFPNGFNTQRYMYKEEIDLITYTSADVISQYSNVSVSVYGEANPRTYKAMHANLPNNAGMRILIQIDGVGF